MKKRFQSKWANLAARSGITLAAVAFVFLLRPDIYASTSARLRSDYQTLVTRKIIAEYMRRTPQPKLQIGSGQNNPDGWLNTDIEPAASQAYLDATKPLPFPDRSLYAIFGEQVIEHVSYDDAVGFMKEARRTLVPGAKIRLITPNLLSFVALFGDQKPATYVPRKLAFHSWSTDSPDPACLILNGEMRSWGHQFVYTPKMMQAALEKAGFTGVRQYAPGETNDAEFRAVELRSQSTWNDLNSFDSMAFEGTR